jgi:hypothetical protein
LNDGELYALSSFQLLVAIHLDGGKMDKDVAAAVLLDETVALGILEPLDSSQLPITHRPFLPTVPRTLFQGKKPASP